AAIFRVAPNVAQIEIMADLVRCGAPFVERRLCRPGGSERVVVDHHTIGGLRSSRALRIAETTANKSSHPKIQMRSRFERRDPAGGRLFDLIVKRKRVLG